jgi:hypothetical protein
MSPGEDSRAEGFRDPILPPYTPGQYRGDGRLLRRTLYSALVFLCLVYGGLWALLTPFLIVALLVPIGIVALVVVWALPETRMAPVQSLSWLLFVFIACLVLWPNYIALSLPGLPWITMVRLTGVPLAFVLLVCVSSSSQFRTALAECLKSTPYIWKLLVAFVVIQTASIAFSDNIPQSLDKFAIAQMSWTSIFFASAYVFLQPGRVERMARLLWVMAIIVGLIAVVEFQAERVLWAGHIPSFLQITDVNVAHILAGTERFGRYRAVSTFGTPLGLGEYMALTMPFLVHYTIKPYPWPTRSAAFASAIFAMVVAILSGARVGTIGCLVSIMLSVAAWSLSKWRRDRESLLAPATSLSLPFLVVGVAATVTFVGRIHQLLWGTGSEKFSDESRIEQLHIGLPKILSHPWGYGISMGAETLNFRPFGGRLTIDNYYLDIALEYGVLGFIVYYSMFLISIYYGLRTLLRFRRLDREVEMLTPITIALTTFFIIKSSFSEQDNHPLVFMMLGMVAALVYRASKEEASHA